MISGVCDIIRFVSLPQIVDRVMVYVVYLGKKARLRIIFYPNVDNVCYVNKHK